MLGKIRSFFSSVMGKPDLKHIQSLMSSLPQGSQVFLTETDGPRLPLLGVKSITHTSKSNMYIIHRAPPYYNMLDFLSPPKQIKTRILPPTIVKAKLPRPAPLLPAKTLEDVPTVKHPTAAETWNIHNMALLAGDVDYYITPESILEFQIPRFWRVNAGELEFDPDAATALIDAICYQRVHIDFPGKVNPVKLSQYAEEVSKFSAWTKLDPETFQETFESSGALLLADDRDHEVYASFRKLLSQRMQSFINTRVREIAAELPKHKDLLKEYGHALRKPDKQTKASLSEQFSVLRKLAAAISFRQVRGEGKIRRAPVSS